MPTQNDQAIHMNSHLLCAIDIEWSGLRPYYHDIIEICIMPLTSTFEPLKTIMPFTVPIRPRYIDRIDRENMSVTQDHLIHIMKYGVDHYTAGEMFLQWFEKLKLKRTKKIVPLTYSWPEVRPYIWDWLGALNADSCFDYRYRDILSTANFLNDYNDWHIENCPIPKLHFEYICSSMKVDLIRPKLVMTNCKAIGEVYKAMLSDSIIHLPPMPTAIARQEENLQSYEIDSMSGD